MENDTCLFMYSLKGSHSRPETVSGRLHSNDISHVIQSSHNKRQSSQRTHFKFVSSPNKTGNEKLEQGAVCNYLMQQDLSVYQVSNISDSTIVEDNIRNTQINVFGAFKSALSLKVSVGVEPTSCVVKEVFQSVISLYFNGSILIENVENLIFCIECNQLRVKNTKNCIVIAHVSSQDVIVEGCCELKFGSLLEDGVIKEATYLVNDLHWPKKTEKNPNVSILDGQYPSIDNLINASFDLDLQITLNRNALSIGL